MSERAERRVIDPRTGTFPKTLKARNDLKRYRHRSCLSKFAYASRDKAIDAILAISRVEGQTGRRA